MKTQHFIRSFKTLGSACAIAMFSASAAQAQDAWGPLELVDMTTSSELSGEILITTGLIDNFEFVAFDAPEQQPETFNAVPDYEPVLPLTYGWRGMIEVDIDDRDTLTIAYVPGGENTLRADDRETRMSGFYTMRYDFQSDTAFRPYAGAGIGLVAAEDDRTLAGGVAARAIAGFDIEVDERSGIFAEYAFVKSSGAMFAEADTAIPGLPDDEHSLKVGFRRTF